MKQLLMNRKIQLLISMAIVIIILTGCGLGNPITADSEGVWDRFFVYPMSWSILQLATIFSGNFGLAIIGMTLIIRFILFPLFLKQQKSSIKMQALKPELDKLRESHKSSTKEKIDTGDKEKDKQAQRDAQMEMQKDMMALYQKHQINPVAGCLPVLVQMPILMALYFAIMRTQEIGTHNFLWFSLGETDPYFILPVLTGLTTWMQFRLSMHQMPEQFRSLMNIFPVVIVFISMAFPTALSVYWVTGNIFMVLQTMWINKVYKPKLEADHELKAEVLEDIEEMKESVKETTTKEDTKEILPSPEEVKHTDDDENIQSTAEDSTGRKKHKHELELELTEEDLNPGRSHEQELELKEHELDLSYDNENRNISDK